MPTWYDYFDEYDKLFLGFDPAEIPARYSMWFSGSSHKKKEPPAEVPNGKFEPLKVTVN